MILAASTLAATTVAVFGSSPSPQRSSMAYSFLQSGLPRHSAGVGSTCEIFGADVAASWRVVPLDVRKYPRAAKARKDAAALDRTMALLLPSAEEPEDRIELELAGAEAPKGAFRRPKEFWTMTRITIAKPR